MKPHNPITKWNVKKSFEKKTNSLGVDSQKVILSVVTIIILSVILSVHLLPSKVSLKLGEKSSSNIVAPRTVRYKDDVETELRKTQAAVYAPKQYDTSANATDQAIGALNTIFHAIESARNNGETANTKTITNLREHLGSILKDHLTDKNFALMLSIKSNELRSIEDNSLRMVSSVMGKDLKEDPSEMRTVIKQISYDAEKLVKNPNDAEVVGQIVQEAIRPNRIYSETKTIALQDKMRDSVQQVYRQIKQGEVVIAKDETVLQEHIEKFEALGLRNPKIDYSSAASLTLFVVLAVMLVCAYLSVYNSDIFNNIRALFLLSLIVILSCLALRISGSLLGVPLNPEQVGFLGVLWVVTAGTLIAVLLSPQTAIIVTSLLSMILSLTLNSELRYAASALVTAYVGIYSVANIRGRSDFIRAVGYIAGVGILLTWILGGISGDGLQMMLRGSVWSGFMIPLGAISLFLVGSWVLERPFGRTTHMTLLELADTNKPILKQLVMEAPGTYTHSVAVGHLAESAAEAIGADSLLARVASYYHDIGKIRRPHFFIENQHVENAHDNINPTLSVLVITSHIKDGLEIAKEYRLPKIITESIEQHHGTSLVQYFYHQFTGEHDSSIAIEQQFRYSGPKPQTKETAIVMLADSVEAASRSLDKPTSPKIELLVNRVISDKLRDGQLDESDLTFRDVAKIANTFIKALVSTMHARIEYPDASGSGNDNNNKKSVNNADTDTEQPEITGENEKNENSGENVA